MKKTIGLLFIILYSITCHSQNTEYLDSISSHINTLSKRDQINIVNSIPFDKVVGDIKNYQVLNEKAIRYSHDLKDSLLLANSLERKVLALYFTTKTEEAMMLSLQVAEIYEKLDKQVKVGETYSNLGWKLKNLNIEKAFQYMRQGILTLEKHEDLNAIHPAYDNYGALFGIKKQWDSAFYYHRKSLKIKKHLNDSIGIPFGYAHLANVNLKIGAYDLAEKYLDSAFFIRQKRNDVYGLADTHLYFGDLYFEKKDYNKAIESFNKGLEISNINGYHPLKKYASEYLFKSYKNINKHKEALYYHLLFTQLKDSIINVETNNKINQLVIEYQTEKKEKEILTQRADLAEKELSLSKKNNQIVSLVILALVFAILGYLFFNQQKLKNKQLQKENELKDALTKIETQNKLQDQRLRISRDLHDNIGAQLTFIISSIDNLKYGFEIVNDKLTNKLVSISAFTKDTIYELRDTIWAMNKSEITFDDLQSRISNFIDKANLASHGIEFEFNIDKNVSNNIEFSSIQGMNIYRIIQEAVNNANKYAKASKIYININQENNMVNIEVVDNGIGFNEGEIELGNGLNNMKKRAVEIDAKLSVTSQKDNGTVVSLSKIVNT